MELVIEKGKVKSIEKQKLSESGRKEVLENSLKRIERKPLQLVERGKVLEVRLCRNCFRAIDFEGKSAYCPKCINAIAERRKMEEFRKDLFILFISIVAAGAFVAFLAMAATGK